jgi:hypothetical protein
MFEVRVVRTYEDHQASIEVASEAFELSPEDADDERRRARETFEAEQAGGHTGRLLALDGGRAVATGQAWFAPQVIYLGGGATIPSYRRAERWEASSQLRGRRPCSARRGRSSPLRAICRPHRFVGWGLRAWVESTT